MRKSKICYLVLFSFWFSVLSFNFSFADSEFLTYFNIAYNSDDPDFQIENYTKAISKWIVSDGNEDLVKAYYNRGLAYYNKSLYNEAIKDYNRALRFGPEYVNGYYNRALAYYYLGKYEESILDNSKTILLDSQYRDAYYNRGLSFYYKENREKSISDLKKAAQLGSEDAIDQLWKWYKIRVGKGR